MKPVIAYIGLGSNLDTPEAQIASAIDAIGDIPDTEIIRCSPLYASKAVGPGEQPDYVNGALAISTTLSAQSLLLELQRIENHQGRTRGPVRWVARTLDLDILLFGEDVIDTEHLSVPHPRIAERNFVLYPLQDLSVALAPDLRLPGGQTVRELASLCPSDGIRRLD